MTPASGPAPHLPFLTGVVSKECRHLVSTDGRIFDQPFTPERAAQLAPNPDLAERVDAFVSRFGRLRERHSRLHSRYPEIGASAPHRFRRSSGKLRHEEKP